MIITYELSTQIDVRVQGNTLITKNTKDKVYCNGLRLTRNPVPGKQESIGCPEEKKESMWK